MDWLASHPARPHASFDGGDLDCGSGLLLLIRKHLDPLLPGQLLEVCSVEASVDEDLPAWCRLTGNELVSKVREGRQRRFLIRKAGVAPRHHEPTEMPASPSVVPAPRPLSGDSVPAVPALPSLAVMGIGSWPRPAWLRRALHDRLEGRLSEEEFEQTAEDAVRLAVQAQERAGVDVLTDGEQRRDSYASFVALRLTGCQLVPIVDLLPYVDDAEKFAAELRALDVPAEEIRQPVVRGHLRRDRPLVVGELTFVQRLSRRPVKVALPGPYLLTRLLSLECISDRVYVDREELAADIVKALREELAALLQAGAALVQFDEPVLTEVVYGRASSQRCFMCGALASRREPQSELAFARSLVNQVTQGFPRDRLAIHICRGNWSRDESVALRGSYEPLIDTLGSLDVGAYLLELCTPRAGEMEILRDLPTDRRLGIGVVNPKSEQVESVEEILRRIERAASLFGAERLLLHPDCGFATFADSPVASASIAEAKLAAIAQAAAEYRGRRNTV